MVIEEIQMHLLWVFDRALHQSLWVVVPRLDWMMMMMMTE